MKRRRVDAFGRFIVAVGLLLTSVSLTRGQESCSTADNVAGQCIPYKQCTHVRQQHASFGKDVPASFRDYLRRSRCRPNANEVYLCCASDPIRTSSTPTPSGEMNARGLAILRTVPCGEPSVHRVSFGEETMLGEFPWMALLRYDDPEEFHCAGTLISSRYVLTAAHCLVPSRRKLLGVRLGEHILRQELDCEQRGRVQYCSPPVEDIAIEASISHPQYSNTDNDIALLRLVRDVTPKIHIYPICLPLTASSRQLDEDQQYFLSGWGTTENGTTSNVLLMAQVPHRPLDFCQNTFRRTRLTDNQICAGGEGRRDSCGGDSGGPLFFLSPYERAPRYVQYGIVSFGVRECGSAKNYPAIYTKVEPYLPWITATIK